MNRSMPIGTHIFIIFIVPANPPHNGILSAHFVYCLSTPIFLLVVCGHFEWCLTLTTRDEYRKALSQKEPCLVSLKQGVRVILYGLSCDYLPFCVCAHLENKVMPRLYRHTFLSIYAYTQVPPAPLILTANCTIWRIQLRSFQAKAAIEKKKSDATTYKSNLEFFSSLSTLIFNLHTWSLKSFYLCSESKWS